jgi:hypothetical protein
MYRITAGSHTESGHCLRVWQKVFERTNGEKVIVQSATDEMKLYGGVYFNCQSCEIIGIEDESDHISGSLINPSEITLQKPAAYVSQWMIRDMFSSSIMFITEHYMVNKGCSGMQLLSQYVWQVFKLTTMNIIDCGLMKDGGGGNQSLDRILTGMSRTPSDPWFDAEFVTFMNWFINDQLMAVASCADHSEKAIRGALHSTARNLFFEGQKITWQVIKELYDREVHRGG